MLKSIRFGLLAPTLALAAQTPFQPDDLLGLAYPEDITVARGGLHAAVRVVVSDIEADVRRSELWMVSRSDGTLRNEVLPCSSQATWSSDGKALRFVCTQDGVSTLRSYDPVLHSMRTLAPLPRAPRYLSWSADGKQVALIASVPPATKPWFTLPAQPATAQKPFIISHVPYRESNGAWIPPGESHLFVVDVASGASREIPLPADVSLAETEVGDGGPPAWSQDGRSVMVSVARGRDAKFNLWNVNRDVLAIDVRTGAHTWIAESPGVEKQPSASPDGRSIAFLRQRGDARAVVFHSDLVVRARRTGREVLPLAGRDVDIADYSWLASGRQLLVRYAKRGHVVLEAVSLDGPGKMLTDGVFFENPSATVSPDDIVAYVRSADGQLPQAVGVTASGAVTEWTSLNEALSSRRLSKLGEIEYRSAHRDGRTIHAIVARPADVADTSGLPVIVDLHGGPYSTRTFSFDADRELFVAQGYVVVQPNYRGSWGYGMAFSQLSDRKHYPGWYDQPDAPSEMGLDVAGALDAVRDQRLGDPKRVFLRGISAGALLTSWTIGRTDGFRAAVSQSWYPGEWSAPEYGWYQIRRYFNGPPWDPQSQPAYWRRQPLMLAERMVTPLLILQGERDWITPLMEAEKFYYTLRSLGRDVQLVIYPDETHGLREHPASHRNSLLMEVAWFRSHDAP